MTIKNHPSLKQKLQKIWLIQKTRYQRKGLVNSIIGFTLYFAILWFARQIGETYWPQNIENKGWFTFFGAVGIHTMAQIWSFLLFIPGYLNWSSYYEKYKINRQSLWPWQRKDWQVVKKKLFFNLIINQLMVYPLIVFLSTVIKVRQRFTDFPSFEEFALQVSVIYFLEDFFFYWGHRLFHTYKTLYKMHKVHHEFDKVYTLATEYFHPFDYALANVMPSALALLMLGSKAHCFTYLFWIAWKITLSNQGHSGYEFPWSPIRIMPMINGPSYHDHHHSHNVGNFSGSCYFWDLMLDTGDEYLKEFIKPQKAS